MKKLITICKYELKYPYYITDDGQIWSEKTHKFITQVKDKDGYMKVRMQSTDGGRHRYSVHRLVLENFLPVENMDSLQVNHKDGNKENNHLDNLEWTTCKENIQHAVANNLRAKTNGSAKLTWEQIEEIRLRASKGESNISLGKFYGVHPDTIGKIKHDKTWNN